MRFSELTQAAKEHAIEKYASVDEPWWYESVVDAAKEDGKELGFEIADIYFSGFWSQGDGASWSGDVDIMKFLEARDAAELDPKWGIINILLKEGAITSYLRIKQGDSHYYHEMTMRLGDILEYFFYDEDSVISYDPLLAGTNVSELIEGVGGESVLTELEQWILEEARDYAKKIYSDLEEEYDYLTSEEAFTETADANDWSFDETGELQ